MPNDFTVQLLQPHNIQGLQQFMNSQSIVEPNYFALGEVLVNTYRKAHPNTELSNVLLTVNHYDVGSVATRWTLSPI